MIRADALISAAAISSAKCFAQIEFVTASPLEQAGFELLVPPSLARLKRWKDAMARSRGFRGRSRLRDDEAVRQ